MWLMVNNIFLLLVYRDILIHEGIWDMVRVDHGTEVCLMLFIQDYLKNLRGNVTCQPYIQTRCREV